MLYFAKYCVNLIFMNFWNRVKFQPFCNFEVSKVT
jgi:hypothetical protein